MKWISYILIVGISLSFIFGCSPSEKTTNPLQNNNINVDSSSSINIPAKNAVFTINDEVKPQISNESNHYETIELDDLNQKNNYKPISTLYFLDNNTIIFSIVNERNNADISEDCDLYKYNLENKELTLICPDYTLYEDDYIKVKDADNFSIVATMKYLNINDNKVSDKRNIFKEAQTKFQSLTESLYNEENDKVLILDNNNAYVTDAQFSSSLKLPFSNVYRVQWADKDHILVVYRDSNGKSILATYSLADESTTLTTFPADNYFIDPVLSDNEIIRFFYLDDPRTVKPWGFLDWGKGTIDRVNFESCNPTSMMRNGRMAGFSQPVPQNNRNNQLFLYDNSTHKMIIRNDFVEYPQAVAVSPDGEKIIFVAGDDSGQCKFFINQR